MPLTARTYTLQSLKLQQRWLQLQIKRSYFTVSPLLLEKKRRVDNLITLRTTQQETV